MSTFTALTHSAVTCLQPCKVHARHVQGDPALRYFVYVPDKISAHAPLFVTVHGVSRNAREHVDRFARLAEEYGVVLVAPYFSKRHFSDYQRLGREGSGRRADLALQAITRDIENLTGADSSKLLLFGYSGGGQFVQRYTMAHPGHVLKVVIGAAGWYTWPEGSRKYPYGIAPDSRLEGVIFDQQRFLQVPACVLVGQWDIKSDPGLNQSEKIQRQQGITRLERGRRWVNAMNRAAMACGIDTAYEFSIIRGIDHDFTLAMKSGLMGQRVFRYLLGAPPVPTGQDDVATLPGDVARPVAGLPAADNVL